MDTLRDKIVARHDLSFGERAESLRLMEQTMAELGNPEADLRAIVVTGTNGSGSTSHLIAELLQQAGYSVGLFSGLTVGGFEYTYRINGEPIDSDELVALSDRVADRVSTRSEWEFLTAMAYLYFSESALDVIVVEPGIGGRYDATNVVPTEVGVITSVELEHTDYLGDSIKSIAWHKAGILDSGSVGVINAGDDAIAACTAVGDDVGARIVRVASPVSFQREGLMYEGSYEGVEFQTNFLAEYQCFNANTAVTAVVESAFDVDATAIRTVLQRFTLPGRAELIKGTPSVVFDGAHNPHAIEAVGDIIDAIDATPVIGLFGVRQEPYAQEMSTAFSRLVDEVVYTESIRGDSTPAEVLAGASVSPSLTVKDVEDAVQMARSMAGADGVIVVAGSLYVLEAARPLFTESMDSPGLTS